MFNFGLASVSFHNNGATTRLTFWGFSGEFGFTNNWTPWKVERKHKLNNMSTRLSVFSERWRNKELLLHIAEAKATGKYYHLGL